MILEKITFKKLTLRDLDRLVTISRSTFSDAFASQNTKANLEHYLNTAFNKKTLKTQLLNPNSEFYFAVKNNEVLGYLKLNFGDAQTDINDDCPVELERIYVLKAHQSKGLGKLLINFVIKQAHHQTKDYIWLGVWDKNVRAIAFYKKLDFKLFGTHSFLLGNDEQTDYLMKLHVV